MYSKVILYARPPILKQVQASLKEQGIDSSIRIIQLLDSSIDACLSITAECRDFLLARIPLTSSEIEKIQDALQSRFVVKNK